MNKFLKSVAHYQKCASPFGYSTHTPTFLFYPGKKFIKETLLKSGQKLQK